MLADVVFWMSMDVTTDLIFGQSYEMLKKPDMRLAGIAIQDGFRRFSLCFQYPALFQPGTGTGKWLDFGTWFLPDTFQMIQTFLAIGTESALRHIQGSQDPKANEGRKDILSRLIGAIDPETGTTFDTRKSFSKRISF
jgi:hypothetical protein